MHIDLFLRLGMEMLDSKIFDHNEEQEDTTNIPMTIDSPLFSLSLQCILSIGGSFTHKSFIPGENREYEKLRSMLIERGGLVVLLLIKKQNK